MTQPLWMLVREAFERKNYFPPSSELRDELVGIAIDYAEQKTAAAHAEIERLKADVENLTASLAGEVTESERLRAEIERLIKGRDEATSTVELVNSNNLTLAAELAGWKQAARQMEAERDEARSQVAAAYEAAAKTCSLAATNYLGKGADTDLGSRSRAICDVAVRIRALTPTHAHDALEAYGREKVREGMKRAADLLKCSMFWDAHKAVLAAMEKESGE